MMSKFPLVMLWGPKRSGNHAISNWLRPQGRFLFFNDIVDIAPILAGKSPLPPACCYADWLKSRTSLRQRLRGRLGRGRILASIEDHELTFRPFIDAPRDTLNIVLIRDPANLFASRIRKAFNIDHPAYPRTSETGLQRVVNLWKDYARECLGETSHLENKVVIYFPRWFECRRYRETIARSLGLRFTDTGFGVVSGHGGGSSFDKTTYNGEGSKMKVLERFRQLHGLEKELLDEMMDDDELVDYAARLDRLLGGGVR